MSHVEIYDLQLGVLRRVLQVPFQATSDRWNNSCFLSESMIAIRGRNPDGLVAVMDIGTGDVVRVYRPEFWRSASWPWVAWSLLAWMSGWLLLSAKRIGTAWLDLAMLVGFVMVVSANTTIGPWIQICLMLGLIQFSVWWMTCSSQPLAIRAAKGIGLMLLAIGIGKSVLRLEIPLYASLGDGLGTFLVMASILGSYTYLLVMGVRLGGKRLCSPQSTNELPASARRFSIRFIFICVTLAAIATATIQLLKHRSELFAHPLAREELLLGLASGIGLIGIWISNPRGLNACLVLIFVSVLGFTTLLVFPMMVQGNGTASIVDLFGDFARKFLPRAGAEAFPLAIAMLASGVVGCFSPAVFSIPFRLRGWGLR